MYLNALNADFGLDEDFACMYVDQLDSFYMSAFIPLSEMFIHEYEDLLDWPALADNQFVSPQFIDDHKSQYEGTWECEKVHVFDSILPLELQKIIFSFL